MRNRRKSVSDELIICRRSNRELDIYPLSVNRYCGNEVHAKEQGNTKTTKRPILREAVQTCWRLKDEAVERMATIKWLNFELIGGNC